MSFRLVSNYQPAGDQPQAISELVEGHREGMRDQLLLGVTGSGKTFTIANVIAELSKPTIVITHNKTLVAQLYGEFQQFFPHNAVECFVSYYDYYQPEAYIPSSNTYIEKDLNINEDLDKLRLKSITQILSGRRDVIVVASVSCIYGAGNPREYENRIIRITQGMKWKLHDFTMALVESLYTRTMGVLERGTFKVLGDTVDIYLPYLDEALRLSFWGDELEQIALLDPQSLQVREIREAAAIFPSNIYLAPKNEIPQIIEEIVQELNLQCEYFISIGQKERAMRLRERVEYDVEMIRELGYCSGVENYSRFFDRRDQGSRPFCLLDYFPKDFLCVIDESHQTIPQIHGMYSGDRSRKMQLVEYGFRLPSALDNRPLNFAEFDKLTKHRIFISATPGAYELRQTEGVIVEQIVRPTGLLDPEIEIRPSHNQIDDLLNLSQKYIADGHRVLVTTLTKKMAEDLHNYLQNIGIRSTYIHSDIDTLARSEIIRALRLGQIDILIGVNLLREGLDLPEVALVVILDADKEGFLRNEKSLTQTIGRAARNIHGRAILYADKITESMQRTITETNRRRQKQLAYNTKHNIIPRSVNKTEAEILAQTNVLSIKNLDVDIKHPRQNQAKLPSDKSMQKASTRLEFDPEELLIKIKQAAKNLDFIEAARLRDLYKSLTK